MRNYKFPNPETKLCFTIGHPVDKQKSLYMHNAGYEKLGLNMIYLVQDVLPENLQATLEAFEKLNVVGISISMPHKVGVVKYLDDVEEDVKVIGACNTISFNNGKLHGYNSDYRGAITCLKRKVDTLEDKNVLILGAGGTSRALIYGLLKERANIKVLNRDLGKVKLLAESFGVEWGDINDLTHYEHYDVIVNATSVGSKPYDECECLLCKFLLSKTQSSIFLENKFALDVVFQRNSTEFTKAAERHGFNVVYGHEMLVEQGAFQFELFTGHKAPVEHMYVELKKALESW